MTVTARPRLEHLVRSRAELLFDGWTDRRIAASVRAAEMHQFRRGWFMDAGEHDRLASEDRHRAHVIAVSRDVSGAAVMSHSSAAVLWGLPLYRVSPDRVHMTTATPRRVSSSTDVFRHVAPLTRDDVAMVDGIRCTSLARTVFDLSRTLSVEAAVSAADAAERQMALRNREWDHEAVASWRAALLGLIDAAGGVRGIRQARWVAGFANGLAQLPGESVSRVQLFRLGFEAPELQVAVPGPRGVDYAVDFGFRSLRAFGEFDGKGKYLDESLRAGRTIEQVVLDEKKREDWIRGSTQWRLARWESAHIGTPAALARRLASFGLTPA